MKGLLIKDFINLRQQLKIYIIIIILWFYQFVEWSAGIFQRYHGNVCGNDSNDSCCL